MTFWKPITELSTRVRASAAPEAAAPPAPTRHPLGFADVRAVNRAPVAPPAPDTRFRTELSFRRQPRVQPAPPAIDLDAAPTALPVAVPIAAPADPAAVLAVGPSWQPLASADGEKVPFYKREITFRRRKQSVGDAEPAEGATEAPENEPPRVPFGFGREPGDGDVEHDELAAEEHVEAVAEQTDGEPEPEPELELETPEEPAEEPVEAAPLATAEDVLEPAIEPAPEPFAAVEPDAADELEVEGLDMGPLDDEAHDDAPATFMELPSFDASGDAHLAEPTVPAEDELFALPLEASATADDELFDSASDDADVTEPGGDDTESSASNGRRSLRRGNGGVPSLKRARGRGGRSGRKVVGLKIGASQLAAAVVSNADGRPELLDLARTSLEPGIVVDGEVKDAAALAGALKTFFDEHALPKRDVRIGLASNRIGVRTFEMSGIDDEERFDNAVRFKAHEVLPVAVHESVLDYRILDERANESGEPVRRVLLVVAPRDQVEPYVAVCRDAGLRLTGIDLEALGLLRTFVEPRSYASRASDDTASVVVAIGHEVTTLLVAGGGTCEFTRVFDWGGATLQAAIAQELDVHPVEAATILRHLSLTGAAKALPTLDDEARARAVDAVRGRLTPFARELVSSLQFYQTQDESLGIGEIVITGGTSHLAGLADSLHQMIGVSVRVGDPLKVVVSNVGFDPSVEATIGSLAVPIGLAIEDDALRSVNLIPRELVGKERRGPALVKVAAPVAAAVPIAALAFAFMSASGTVSDRESELSGVRAEIAALPEPKRPQIDPTLAASEIQRAAALASVLGGRVSWDGMLRQVSLVLPANVSLTRLSAQLPETPPPGVQASPVDGLAAPNGVQIEGYTDDQPSVARLMARLATLPSLASVQLQSSTRELVGKREIVRFVVIANVAGGS